MGLLLLQESPGGCSFDPVSDRVAGLTKVQMMCIDPCLSRWGTFKKKYMNTEQVKQGAGLLSKIEAMMLIEDRLRSERIGRIQLFTEGGASTSIYKHQNDGQAFVVEKMIEAGLYAAMTVRAMAENDLEKL
jgi:hypothetical protein